MYSLRNLMMLVPVIFMVACGQHSEEANPVAKEMVLASVNDNRSSSSDVVMLERKLIRSGDFTFEVENVTDTKKYIEAICNELKAYSSSESQNNLGDRIQLFQTIRVPAKQFDNLLVKLESLALSVENKSINTQDVTEEFIDVEARLATKKSLEERYLEILKQAKTVADIVSIESQIASVRADIESMEGRINYLKNQVSFSTLQVSYFQRVGTDFGFFGKAARALGSGWDNFLSFTIMLINLWPFMVLILGVWFLIKRLVKKRA